VKALKVKFFALLRDITGVKETGDFTGATIRELLDNLCLRYGREFTDWVYAPQEAGKVRRLSGNVIILINGRAIEHLGWLDAPLTPTDEVALFPRMAGG